MSQLHNRPDSGRRAVSVRLPRRLAPLLWLVALSSIACGGLFENTEDAQGDWDLTGEIWSEAWGGEPLRIGRDEGADCTPRLFRVKDGSTVHDWQVDIICERNYYEAIGFNSPLQMHFALDTHHPPGGFVGSRTYGMGPTVFALDEPDTLFTSERCHHTKTTYGGPLVVEAPHEGDPPYLFHLRSSPEPVPGAGKVYDPHCLQMRLTLTIRSW